MIPKSETKIIAVLAAINFVNIVDFMVLMPLAAQIKNTFQLGTYDWGLVVSAYTISAFVAGILALFMIDRFNRKNYLMVNMIGFLLGTVLCGFADSFASLLFARLFAGFFGGVIGSVSIAMISDLVPMERRGRAMGIFMGGFAAAAALGVPFGTILGAKETFGWNFPFLALTVIGIIFMFIAYLILPSVEPSAEKSMDKGKQNKNNILQSLTTLKEIMTNSNQLWGFLLMGLLSFAQFMIVPFFSPYLVTNLGLNEYQLAGVYCVGGVMSIATSPFIGKLSDKLGHIKVFTIMASLAVIPIWFCTNMKDVPYSVVLIASGLFFALVGGRFTPAVALMISTAAPHQRGVFNTLRNSFQNGVAGLAALFAGAVVTQINPSAPYEHYALAGYISIGVNLLCIVVIRKLKATN